MEKLGLIGFKCPKRGNEPVEFDYCFHKCKDRCRPLPLLHALSRDVRWDPMTYSTTELLGPPQIGYLKRHNAYFATPDSLIWATFGSAWHLVMLGHDDKMSPEHVLEDRFKIHIAKGYHLTGQYDYYDGETKTLWDFKTLKVYPAKKYLAGNWEGCTFPEQLNIYRLFGRPDAERLRLECIVKDWSRAAQVRDNINPTMEYEIGIMNEPYVTGLVEVRLGMHIQDTPDLCPREDLWISDRGPDKGIPKRCRDYCEVSDVCPQYQKHLKGEDK